jgi:4-hydroxy-3-methylbut-2-enyl diphosphate reductase
LLGWAAEKGIAALDVEEIVSHKKAKQGLSLRRLGIISQTTQTTSAFIEFVKQLMVMVGSKSKEMHIVNTLCQATQKRQEAALSLAQKSQLMIVVGGYNSANTRRLAEACSPIVETHLVERADEVDYAWFEGKHCIGITAGASTPDETIEDVITKLKSFKATSVIASG